MKLPAKAFRSQRRALEAVKGLHVDPANPLAWVIWMPSDNSPRPPQVLPASDTRQHVLCTYAQSCWCEPTYTHEGILVHNAADGRERYESDTGLLQHKKN